MGATLNTMLFYCGILTLQNADTVVNYCSVFMMLVAELARVKYLIWQEVLATIGQPVTGLERGKV
jgi:hypothetical protein